MYIFGLLTLRRIEVLFITWYTEPFFRVRVLHSLSFYYHDRFRFFIEAHHASVHRLEVLLLVAAGPHQGLLFVCHRSSSRATVSYDGVIGRRCFPRPSLWSPPQLNVCHCFLHHGHQTPPRSSSGSHRRDLGSSHLHPAPPLLRPSTVPPLLRSSAAPDRVLLARSVIESEFLWLAGIGSLFGLDRLRPVVSRLCCVGSV
jgi:hypothetical protein